MVIFLMTINYSFHIYQLLSSKTKLKCYLKSQVSEQGLLEIGKDLQRNLRTKFPNATVTLQNNKESEKQCSLCSKDHPKCKGGLQPFILICGLGIILGSTIVYVGISLLRQLKNKMSQDQVQQQINQFQAQLNFLQENYHWQLQPLQIRVRQANRVIMTGSIIAGTSTGALIGSVVPVVGTAIGGAVGGAVGGITGLILTLIRPQN